MEKRYIDWSEYGDLIDALIQKVSHAQKKYDGIIGISRGGLPIAVSLSHGLKLPISQIIRAASYDEDNEQGELQIFTQLPEDLDTTKKWLIVDDICDTGQTLSKLKEMFPASDTCVLVAKSNQAHTPDFWVES